MPFLPLMSGPTDIVKRLGGPEVLADRFGVSLKAIEMWERRNGIPGKWHVPMLLLAAERGVSLSLDELASAPEPAEARG